MALSFSEGSIGGDIEQRQPARARGVLRQSIARQTDDAARRVGRDGPMLGDGPPEPTGSNGIAIAGANTASGKAMLLINPHTSFFFREEAQMVERGRPERLRRADLGPVLHLPGLQRQGRLDAHVEQRRQHRRVPRDGRRRRPTAATPISVGAEEKPLVAKKIVVPYKSANGMAQREFTTYRTHRGPIVRAGRRQVGERAADGRAAEGADRSRTRAPRRATSTNTRR